MVRPRDDGVGGHKNDANHGQEHVRDTTAHAHVHNGAEGQDGIVPHSLDGCHYGAHQSSCFGQPQADILLLLEIEPK